MKKKNVFEIAEEITQNSRPAPFADEAIKRVIDKIIEEEKGKCSCQMRKHDNNK